jgi:hypothetical protein
MDRLELEVTKAGHSMLQWDKEGLGSANRNRIGMLRGETAWETAWAKRVALGVVKGMLTK